MTLKSYLWTTRLATFLALVGWGIVVVYINPQEAGILGKFLFYLGLFFSVSGIFTILLGWLRRSPKEENMSLVFWSLNLREGLLLGILVTFLLALQGWQVLTWWDGLLTVAGVFLIELYFLSR